MTNKSFNTATLTQSKNQKIISILLNLINIILIPYLFLIIMIKNIARFILKKEFEENLKHQNIFISNSNKYYNEARNLKTENKILKNGNLRIRYLFNDRCNKNNIIITQEVTNKGNEVIVAVVEDSDGAIEIEIFDIESHFYASNRTLVLWCEREGKEYCISDIQGGNGKGHGEIAMKKLFELAEKENISRIVGELVPVDFLNRDRQIAFYQKMGFKIILSDEKQNGFVEKYLTC